jgi:HlyD family secretion protein
LTLHASCLQGVYCQNYAHHNFASTALSRPIISSVFLLALVFGLVACSNNTNTNAETSSTLKVSALRVQSQSSAAKIELYGQLVAKRQVLIKPLIDGARIESVLIEEGQNVTAGQALLKLDTRSLVSDQQQQLQQRVRAQALAQSSAAQLAQSESRLAQSFDELSRYRSVANTGAVSPLELNTREKNHAQLRAERDSAARNLAAAQAELGQADAAANFANERFKDGIIRAPFAGVISERRAEIGALTNMSDAALFTLAASNDREFEAFADAGLLQQLAIGDTAEIRLPNINKPFSGKIRTLDRVVSSDNQRGRIRISINELTDFPLGHPGQVSIKLGTKTGIILPASALQFDPAPWVFVVDKKQRLSKRQISLLPNTMQVISGLNDGEIVVRSAASLLSAGQMVEPIIVNEKGLAKK